MQQTHQCAPASIKQYRNEENLWQAEHQYAAQSNLILFFLDEQLLERMPAF